MKALFNLVWLVIAGIGVYKVVLQWWIQVHGERIIGRVVRHEEKSDEDGTSYLSIAVFALHGRNYEAKGMVHQNYPDKIGGEVDICYLPNDPAAARIYYPVWKLVVATGIVAMFLALGLSGLWRW